MNYSASRSPWLLALLLTLCASILFPAEESAPVEAEIDLSTLDNPATYDEAYNGFDDFSFVEEYLAEEEKEKTTAVDTPTDIPLLDFDLPIFGTVTFYLATDSATGKTFYRAKIAEGKKIYLGRLVLEAPVLEIIKGNLSITSRTYLFDKTARVGLINLVFDEKKKTKIKTAEFGIIFDDPVNKPTIELLPGKKFVVLKQRLVFEQDKPAVVVANVEMFDKPTNIGIIFTGGTVGAFLTIEQMRLLQLIEDVQGTPLSDAMITTAKIEIENLIVNAATKLKKEKYDLTVLEDQHLLTLDMTGFLAIPEIKENLLTAQKAQEAGDVEFHAVINEKKVILDASSKNFPVHNIGVIKEAKIHLYKKQTKEKKGDTEKIEAVASIKEVAEKKEGFTVSGTLLLDVVNIGTLTVKSNITVDKEKTVFSGTLKNSFTYNNFVIKPGVNVSYNTAKKSFGFSTMVDFEGLAVKIGFALTPNKKEPSKKDVTLSATAEADTFTPFKNSGIKSLEDLYVTDLDIGFDIERAANGKIAQVIKINGMLHMLGEKFKSEIRIVSDDKGKKGIFIQAPLQEDITLGDILLGFDQPPLNGITFKKVEFLASSITFVDPTTKATISKGISMTAKVPLTGALAPVATYLGTANQELTVQGAILPNDPKKSSVSALLSRGVSDPTKVVSMGDSALIIKGEPAIGIKASMTFRPEPQKRPEQAMDFAGELSLAAKELEFVMQMDGMWEEPFGFHNMAIGNLIAAVGMMPGSPGTPTKIGIRGRLDYDHEPLVDTTMVVSANLTDCGMKGTFKKIISIPDLVLMFLADQGIDLGPLDIPLCQLEDAQVAIAPTKDIALGVSGREEIINQGVEVNSKILFLGKKGELGILIRTPTLSGENFGLKAYGTLEQINIADLLMVTGKGGVGDPIIDLELTLLRQKCLVSGRINLANLCYKEAYLEITSNSIEFNFEEAIGGAKFNYNGQPLLFSRVHGLATALDTNFMLEIQFKEYLQKYLKNQINAQFNAAKKEVEDQINSAKKEVDTVRTYAQEVEQQIIDARNAVTAAKKEVDSLDESIKKAQAGVARTQADVDILKRKIETQRNRIDKAKNILEKTQHVGELLAYDLSLKAANASLSTAKNTATGTLIASRETAKAALTAAEQFLDTIVKNGSNALFYTAADTANAILESAKSSSYLVLSGSEYVITLPLNMVEINEVSYHGELKTIKDGKLGNVLIKATIGGIDAETTIDIDVKKGLSTLTNSLNNAAQTFTDTLNTIVLDPLQEAATIMKQQVIKTRKVQKMDFNQATMIEMAKKQLEEKKKEMDKAQQQQP